MVAASPFWYVWIVFGSRWKAVASHKSRCWAAPRQPVKDLNQSLFLFTCWVRNRWINATILSLIGLLYLINRLSTCIVSCTLRKIMKKLDMYFKYMGHVNGADFMHHGGFRSSPNVVWFVTVQRQWRPLDCDTEWGCFKFCATANDALSFYMLLCGQHWRL